MKVHVIQNNYSEHFTHYSKEIISLISCTTVIKILHFKKNKKKEDEANFHCNSEYRKMRVYAVCPTKTTKTITTKKNYHKNKIKTKTLDKKKTQNSKSNQDMTPRAVTSDRKRQRTNEGAGDKRLFVLSRKTSTESEQVS